MKKHFSGTGLCLLILISSFNCFSQGAIKKCLIVSDIHFDPLFGAHRDTAFKHKLEKTPVEEWKKLFESSAAQMTINNTLYYQDANYGVLKSALTNMKAKLPNPAFIIIVGDFIWHGAKPADSILKKKCIRFIANLFKEHFPVVTIVPAMGNNDTYGADYALQDSRFLNDFADPWAPNLPKSSGDQLKMQGYYSCESGNLKVMVINSALVGFGTQYPQAATMLNWLQTNLASSKTKNVWILMHIPPGTNVYNSSSFWNVDQAQTFINSIVKNSSKVKFGIASHTHFSDFRVFYNADKKPVPVAFMRIVPSICSNHGNNPSFEVAEFNSTTSRIIKETNYYLNLAAIPKDNAGAPLVWDNTLSFPALIKQNEDDAQGFSKFIDNIKTDPLGQSLGNYSKFYSVGTKIDSSIRVNRVNYSKYLKADSLKAK